MNEIEIGNAINSILMDKLYQASEYVAEELIKLNKDTIQQVVYDVYHPNIYQRNGEMLSFKNAWDKKVNQTSANTVTTNFYYEPNKMDAHTSVITGENINSYLVDIIYQGLAGHIFGVGKWTEERNAFDELVKKLQNRELENFIIAGLKQVGLKVIK